jgi:hypothetical protein
MSDFSPQEQSFAFMPAGIMPLLDVPPREQPSSTEVQPRDVSFRQLRGHEIARVLHLRKEILLPTAARSDGSFATREKKEMKLASWADSSTSVNTSAPCACSR